MGQIDKNSKNEFFKVAVDYIYKEHLVNNQGELAEKIGISTSALSRIMNNKKFVGDDTLRKMNEAFGGIFNMAYFRGESVVLLIEDVAYYKSHPGELNRMFNGNDKSDIDQSIMINATLAAKDETIAALRNQLKEKDAVIASKDETIQLLRQQLSQYKLMEEKMDDTYDIIEGVKNQMEMLVSIYGNQNATPLFPMTVNDDGSLKFVVPDIIGQDKKKSKKSQDQLFALVPQGLIRGGHPSVTDEIVRQAVEAFKKKK